MMSIAEIEAILAGHCLVIDHDILPRQHVRIGTKLLMIDGSAIDIFMERGNLTRAEGFALSDLGQTMETLSEYGIRPRDRKEMIRSAIDSSGVRLFDDRLVLELSESNDFAEGIITLAQACLRVSCIAFTRKAPQQKEFRVQVREALRSTGLALEPNYRYSGPYEQDVKVDYRVTETPRPVAVLKLGPQHIQANEVYRKWVDLEDAAITDRRVTIFDDSRTPDNRADIRRLSKLSEVVAVSNRRMLVEVLRQAA